MWESTIYLYLIYVYPLMRRLNIVVSDEAGKALDRYRDAHGFKSLDSAMDCILIELKKEKEAICEMA